MGDGHNFRQLRAHPRLEPGRRLGRRAQGLESRRCLRTRVVAGAERDAAENQQERAGRHQQARLPGAGLMKQEDIERIVTAAMTAFMFSKEAQRGED